MEKEKQFKSFTNLYELLKTLRFELRPVGNTQKMLEDNKVFEKDQTIDDSYNQAKFYFDTLHQKFIKEALAVEKVKNLSFGKFADNLSEQNNIINQNKLEITELRKEKDKTKEIDKLQKNIYDAESKIDQFKKELYAEIKKLLDERANFWKKEYQEKEFNGNKIKFSKADIKQEGTNFLTSAGVLGILKYEFPKEKEREFKLLKWPSLYVDEQESKETPKNKKYIFDSFNKFSGYLSKFQQTRKNLYADNGIATAVATRIVDNFIIFLQNKKVFAEKYNKVYIEIGFDEISIFDIKNYGQYLLQDWIEALPNDGEENNKSYNKIIGRINQKIKEYRDQKESEVKKQKDRNFKKSQYPLFKKLDKQILGKVEKEKQLIEKTKEKTEEQVLIERFQEFINNNQNKFSIAKKLMNVFFADEFLENYIDIYLKNTAVNTIARKWFADARNFELKLPQKQSKKKDDEPNVKKFISLLDIKSAVEVAEGNIFKEFYYEKNIIQRELNENDKQSNWKKFLDIWQYEFINLFNGIKKENGEIEQGGYDYFFGKAKGLAYFSRKKQEIEAIKNYADASLAIFQMMKYFALNDKDRANAPSQLSTEFYARYDEYCKDFEFIKYYNALRNFITKKPFDENKIKLNFEKNPPILKGFSKQYSSYLLKKNHSDKNEFFLGILKSGEIDETIEIKNKSDYSYFPATQLKFQNLINKAFEPRFGYVYSQQKDEQKAVSDAQIFIKERHLSSYPKLQSLIDGKFLSKKEFKDKANKVCFEIYAENSFFSLDKSQIEDKNNRGELFLFQISSKDWMHYKKEKSQKNIHTLYFEQLFSPENLKNPKLKISGGSEMFLRELTKQLKDQSDHIITKENKKDITEFLKNKFGAGKYAYNRYLERKYFLYLSIVLNYGHRQKMPQNRDRLNGFVGKFNKDIRQKLKKHIKDVNIIGIDRGEKNLIYYSVINQKGDIYEQGSLNEIEIGGKKVNFYDKLVAKEKERLENRQSWEPVVKIKNLKDGYISHVVYKICYLVEKYNAIVVLEDLNMRFKQIRGGIERSVYSQLEKRLIDKFGYLVFKDKRGLDEPGGVLNGYQLSAPFVSFEKMGKQTGIIFYTQADYTSITDPLTGFRKNIYISNSAPYKKIKEAIEKFDDIGWDEQEQSYYFRYNPAKFANEKDKKGIYSPKDGWTIYAKAPRIRREKGKNGYWEYEKIDLNEKFVELFKIWNFTDNQKEIRRQILTKDEVGELKGEKTFDGKSRSFYHSFIYLFNLVLQLRNSFSLQIKIKDGKACETELSIDFIASPVKPFFSTEAIGKNSKILSLSNFSKFENKFIGLADDKQKFIKEFNGDANGAYNIARKGIIILERINKNSDKPDLFIGKTQWDEANVKWAKENGL